MADKQKKAAAKQSNAPKAAAAKAAADKKPAKKAGKKPNRVLKFFRDLKSEIKKVVWLSPKAAWRNVGVVAAVIAVIGLVVFGLDQGFQHLLALFMDMGT